MQWIGAAGICVNEQNECLMVLQGRPEEKNKWAIPSGKQEEHETLEQACIREVKEETGYDVDIQEKIFVKHDYDHIDGFEVEVHYFAVKLVGGTAKIQDPDELIYDVQWKSAREVPSLELSFPDDLEMLLRVLKQKR